MDVIFRTADALRDAALGTNDAAEIVVQTIGYVRRDPRLAVLGGEDDVKQELRIGARQVAPLSARRMPPPRLGGRKDTG